MPPRGQCWICSLDLIFGQESNCQKSTLFEEGWQNICPDLTGYIEGGQQTLNAKYINEMNIFKTLLRMFCHYLLTQYYAWNRRAH